MMNNLNLVKILIDKKNVDINEKDKNKMTILHLGINFYDFNSFFCYIIDYSLAITYSNKNVTEFLINNPNIDLSAQDKLNQTPFQIGTF
jgi:hypothetical protein